MPETAPEFDIKRYWAVVMKRRYLALAVAVVIISVATVGSYLWPKTYEASSTVFIERSSLLDPLLKGVGVSNTMEDRLRTLKNSITSRNIVERVMKKLDLDVKVKNPANYEALIDGIRDSLSVEVKGFREKETDLFKISYRGSDPKTVQNLVNALVSEFIEENVGFRRTDAYGAYEFIQGQLVEYKKKLEDSDKATREFREKNPTMVPQSETTVMTRIEGFQTAHIEAEIRLKELLRRKDNLQKQLSGEKELTVAFVSREGSPQARLNHLNNQLMLLMTKYTDRYPEVIKVKAEIEELKKQIAQAKDSKQEHLGAETSAINPIYQQLKEDLAKTDAEIESLRARSSELSRQKGEAQGVLGRMPKEQEEWTRLQRDRNVYQSIYNDLLVKLENARVSKDLELTDKSATFRVVDPAVYPHVPVKPDRVKVIALGLVLGLGAGIGIAVALEQFDRSFKTEDAIQSDLRLPVLAAIPKIVTEEDRQSSRKLDKKVFTAAAAYLGVILVVLTLEVLNRYMGIRVIPF